MKALAGHRRGGMLGRDVVLAAGNAGHDVVGFGRAELDVTDADAA